MRLHRFLQYAAVGATGTCVQYLILIVIVSFGLAGPVFGSSAGAVAGAIVNYLLNYHLTFRSNEKHVSTAPKFFFVALIGLGVNWFVMENFIYLFNIHYLFAQCAATALVLVITFLANRAWSFKSKSHGTRRITDVLETSKLERTPTQASASMLVMMVLSFVIFTLILAAYIGLIPIGHWQDEFQTFPVYSSDGWKALLSRLISWSPRPFSELLIFAYAHMVERYHSALIGSVLSALWLMLSLSILAGPMAARQAFPSAMSRWQITLLSLGLYCLMLMGHPVSEFFYWPQSAAAYIPAIAGVCAVMWIFIVSGTNNMKARWASSAMLTGAALSAEVSAMLVTVFCLLLFFQVLMDKLGRKPTVLTDRGVLWLTIPFVAAATVLIAVRFGRFESAVEIFGDSSIAHHLIPTLSEAALTFLGELLSVDGVTMTPMSLALGLATKALFFMAAYSILRPVVASRTAFHTDRRLLALFSLACFATVFLTIAAAFYQFGLVCCERHGTFRQLLIFLGLISFSAFAAGWTKLSSADSAKGHATTKSIILLIASVLISASISAPGIAYEYRNYRTYLEVNQQNWSTGIAPGDQMVYRLLPPGKIIGGVSVPAGTYTLTDDSGWFIHSIISYFHKKSITFETVDVNTQLAVKPMTKPPVALLAPLKQPAPQCSVDRVNGQLYQAGPVQRSKNGTLKLEGWTGPALSAESDSMSTWIVVSSQNGKKHYFETAVEERPDVVAALKRPALKDAGFSVTLDFNALPHKQAINLISVSRDISYDCGMAIEVN